MGKGGGDGRVVSPDSLSIFLGGGGAGVSDIENEIERDRARYMWVGLWGAGSYACVCVCVCVRSCVRACVSACVCVRARRCSVRACVQSMRSIKHEEHQASIGTLTGVHNYTNNAVFLSHNYK